MLAFLSYSFFFVPMFFGANFSGFNDVVLSVVDDVPVDSETPTVTSRRSREFAGLVFEDTHRGRVCVLVFIGMNVFAL